MKIVKRGVMSKHKTDALVKALGVTVKTEPKNRAEDYFIVNGVILDSYPEVGHRLLSDLNFFIEVGLNDKIDLDYLLGARDSKGLLMFFKDESS